VRMSDGLQRSACSTLPTVSEHLILLSGGCIKTIVCNLFNCTEYGKRFIYFQCCLAMRVPMCILDVRSLACVHDECDNNKGSGEEEKMGGMAYVQLTAHTI